MNKNSVEAVRVYITKEDIEGYIKSKLQKEHQHKNVVLSDVRWNYETDESIDFEFLIFKGSLN